MSRVSPILVGAMSSNAVGLSGFIAARSGRRRDHFDAGPIRYQYILSAQAFGHFFVHQSHLTFHQVAVGRLAEGYKSGGLLKDGSALLRGAKLATVLAYNTRPSSAHLARALCVEELR